VVFLWNRIIDGDEFAKGSDRSFYLSFIHAIGCDDMM